MSNLKEVVCILDELRALSGNAQIEKLKEYKNNALLKEVLLYCYDPNKQYKIKEAKFNKVNENFNFENLADPKPNWEDFKSNLDILSELKGITEEEIENLICSVSMIDTFKQILFKDLRLGMDIKSFQKVWPDFCLAPQVMLAKEFDGKMPENALISRKLDGRRGYFLNGKFYSRNNKEYKTVNIQHIIDELNQIENINNYVLDGEFVYIDEQGNEDFSKTGIVTRDKYTEDSKNIKFAVFYALDKDDFINKRESKLSFARLYLRSEDKLNITEGSINGLTKTMSSNILLVEQYNKRCFDDLLKESKEKGWEGLMILDSDKTYQYKRTNVLQKVKEFHDAEFLITKITSGTGKYSETLGYFTVELPTGESVDVGSGFKDYERHILWSNSKITNGNYFATVQYFEETIDKNGKRSLRFPVFKGLRDKDGNEISIEEL